MWWPETGRPGGNTIQDLRIQQDSVQDDLEAKSGAWYGLDHLVSSVLADSELFKRVLGTSPELASHLFSRGTSETPCSGTTESATYIGLEEWWGAPGCVCVYVAVHAHTCRYVNKCMHS